MTAKRPQKDNQTPTNMIPERYQDIPKWHQHDPNTIPPNRAQNSSKTIPTRSHPNHSKLVKMAESRKRLFAKTAELHQTLLLLYGSHIRPLGELPFRSFWAKRSPKNPSGAASTKQLKTYAKKSPQVPDTRGGVQGFCCFGAPERHSGARRCLEAPQSPQNRTFGSPNHQRFVNKLIM